MIKAFANVNELNKELRTVLMTQAELDGQYVRNALSTFGETLDKLLFKQTYDSISPCDQLMLFELRSRQNKADVSMTEADDSVTFYKSYELYVIVYGENAADVMNKLIARLRTQAVRLQLIELGIFLEEVGNDNSLNEFKNNVMFHRHDCSVNISCRFSIEQVNSDYLMENGDIDLIAQGDSDNE